MYFRHSVSKTEHLSHSLTHTHIKKNLITIRKQTNKQTLDTLFLLLTYLFWLFHSLLGVRLHLVVGVICYFGHWLFEDGSCLSNWQRCV